MNQRKLIERKLAAWLRLREDKPPPSGWLKAIRGALGMNTRQLAARLGVEHSAILQFEKREAQGKVSLETIEKVARAMNCKLVYAIVPDEPFTNLESIVDEQALKTARAIVMKVDHTMRLEQQGISLERSHEKVKELAAELKIKMGSKFWNSPK